MSDNTNQNDKHEQPENRVGYTLFDLVSYPSVEVFEKFVDSMALEQALLMLSANARYSQQKGILTMEESECLSKASRIVSRFISSNILDKKAPSEE